MPFNATCPDCRTTLRLADTMRNKRIRCSNCQAVFAAGSANGNSASVKPAAKPRAAPRPQGDDSDDSPRTEKKKKSILPAVLLGCGTLFLLCGGGVSVGGYLIYRGLNKAADNFKEKGQELAAEFDKAQKDELLRQEKLQKEREKAAQEERNKARSQVPPLDAPGQQTPPPQNEQPRPAVTPLDQRKLPVPDPPAPAGTSGQVSARTIPLPVPTTQVVEVLFSPPQNKRVAVALRPDPLKKEVRLDRFDLTTGSKVDHMLVPYDPLMRSRDISPDGNYYVHSHGGAIPAHSIYAWGNPTPLVDRWLVPPPQKSLTGDERTTIAAYLLDGARLLTVNALGQVALWSIPSPGGRPEQKAAYVPPETVARYASPMGYNHTAISPDRKRLAVANGSDGFFVLDTDTLQLIDVVRSLDDAFHAVLGIAFRPDGKQLAALFNKDRIGTPPPPRPRPSQKRPPKGTRPPAPSPPAATGGPTLVRWDLESKKMTARLTDLSGGSSGEALRIGWWGMDHCWVYYRRNGGTLVSWDKKAVVLREELRPSGHVLFCNADDNCWFMVAAPDNKTLLKSVDLPAEQLKQADQPLVLRHDRITRK